MHDWVAGEVRPGREVWQSSRARRWCRLTWVATGSRNGSYTTSVFLLRNVDICRNFGSFWAGCVLFWFRKRFNRLLVIKSLACVLLSFQERGNFEDAVYHDCFSSQLGLYNFCFFAFASCTLTFHCQSAKFFTSLSSTAMWVSWWRECVLYITISVDLFTTCPMHASHDSRLVLLWMN